MHRPRPGGIRLEGDDFHRDDFHTYPSSRHSGATFVPRCSCTVSGAGCSRHRIPPRSANVFMHLASPWAGARGHGCVRLVIRVNVRILNASWWMIVMGGHERGQVSYFQLIFRIFLFLSFPKAICCACCYKIEYRTRFVILLWKIDFTDRVEWMLNFSFKFKRYSLGKKY